MQKKKKYGTPPFKIHKNTVDKVLFEGFDKVLRLPSIFVAYKNNGNPALPYVENRLIHCAYITHLQCHCKEIYRSGTTSIKIALHLNSNSLKWKSFHFLFIISLLLHRPRQHSCRGLCKSGVMTDHNKKAILCLSLYLNVFESKMNFVLRRIIIGEMGHWT